MAIQVDGPARGRSRKRPERSPTPPRSAGRKVTRRERLRIEQANRALLEHELLTGKTFWESRPYEAHIQFSNFCNMSCVMCYGPGGNPPLRKMSPEILQKVEDQIASSLSVVIPYGGSEPLAMTWDVARSMAEQHSIDLRITTNVQFLDEDAFHQLKDITETLFLSIDSHNRETFEKIRPGSKSDKVFQNLESTARLATEHGVECLAQVVFMTENAPSLPETLEYFADVGIASVNVLQLIDVNGRSGYLDPLLHFSAEYIDWIREKCVKVSRRRGTRLIWNVAQRKHWDFRKEKVPPDMRKDWNHRWDIRMSRIVPGFCRYAYDRLQINLDGEVMPCAYATDGELLLGNLAEQDFDQIWNSPNAQDLRRAHATWDYPSLCKTCMFTDRAPPEVYLPFVDSFLQSIGRNRRVLDCSIEIEGPAHMTRQTDPPKFSVRRPDREVDDYFLVLSLGGETDQIEISRVTPLFCSTGTMEFELPTETWLRLRANLGYWWALFGVEAGQDGRVVRTSPIQCVVRHEESPRLPGSTLRYPDHGHRAVVDLGGAKQAGFSEAGGLPARPDLGERRRRLDSRDRRDSQRRRSLREPTVPKMTQQEYRKLAERIRTAGRELLPPDATVLVASNGDENLLDLGCRVAWHFPSEGDGAYAGDPSDGGSAVRQLTEFCARGADYLLIPAHLMWWLRHYRELSDHLAEHALLVLEDEQTCALFGLGSHPALYGAQREAELRDHQEAVRQRLESKGAALKASNGGKQSATREEATPGGDVNGSKGAASSQGSDLVSQAREMLAYGGHHRALLRPLYAFERDAFPNFAVEGRRYELTDSEGRTFVDWINGFGASVLGYRRPEVEEAVKAQLAAGPTLSLIHPIEVEVAAMLIEMIPCAEMVAFGKNGSDVTTAAVRVAKAVTGRELILQHGFHGFHDWYSCQYRHEHVQGIPSALRAYLQSFPYNDLGALNELLERHPGEVAAVLMEPVNAHMPNPGYLEGVRELAHEHGALLIFDEIVTGFRLANGGAQELFGVTPDLACFGKAIANGMPLSVVVGKREYMERLPNVAYGMTYRDETLSMAAARAVLRILKEEPVCQHLAQIGEQLREVFNEACSREGINAKLTGPPARMTVGFDHHGSIPFAELHALFLCECAKHGVLSNGNYLGSYAHDDEALRRTKDGFVAALEVVGRAVREGGEAVHGAVQGGFSVARAGETSANGSEAGLPSGHIDVIGEEEGLLKIWGWVLLEDGGPDAVELVAKSGERVPAQIVKRPDVAEFYPGVARAEDSGYAAVLPPHVFAEHGTYEFEIRATRGDRTVFQCDVVRPRRSDSSALYVPHRDADGVLYV